jgi:hypothetical protein
MTDSDFKKCYNEIEQRKTELENKWIFCNEHKFEHECKALNLQIDALGFALTRMRLNNN